jgi:thioredoxin reductase
MPDVVVVGAGHNGLVAACYLAKAGLDVLVVERGRTPGGMTSTNPMAPEAPDHMINEASIHASLFRTTNIAHPIAGINGMPGMNAAKTLIKSVSGSAARRHVELEDSVSDEVEEPTPTGVR